MLRNNEFFKAEDYYICFETNGTSLDEAIKLLVNTETTLAMYVLVQIYGNDAISQRLGWSEAKLSNKKYFDSLVKGDYNIYFKHLYLLLPAVSQSKIVGIQHLMGTPVKDLTYDVFRKAFSRFVSNRQSLSTRINMASTDNTIRELAKKKPKLKKVESPIYEKYDNGISDW
jgi:hypothetical protein